MQISQEIKNSKPLYYAALIQLVYGLIELADSVAIVLITLQLLPNFYIIFPLAFPEILSLLTNEPVWFIPIFIFFTTFRLSSGYWILHNKAKGFWLAIFISIITLIAFWYLLPFSIIDLIATGLVMFLLTIGYFQDQPIIPNKEVE